MHAICLQGRIEHTECTVSLRMLTREHLFFLYFQGKKIQGAFVH
jgi:hypothetical protein